MPEKLNKANNSHNPTNTDKNLLNLVFGENGNKCDENICPMWILALLFVWLILFLFIFCFSLGTTNLTVTSSILLYILLCALIFFLFYSYFCGQKDCEEEDNE